MRAKPSRAARWLLGAAFVCTSACDFETRAYPLDGRAVSREWVDGEPNESPHATFLFTAGSLRGSRAAAREVLGEGACAELTENRLLAMMLAIPVWELAAGEADMAPSPMTLSRWDGWSNAKNHTLYSFGTYEDDKRAHWNPGVGLWQLDTWSQTLHLSHAERMDVRIAGVAVGRYLRDGYCEGDEALRGRFNRTWFACRTDRCWETYRELYGSGDTLNAAETVGNSTSGGTRSTLCRWGTSGTPFLCAWIDPNESEGYMDTLDPEGVGARTPLAAPFLSFAEAGYKRAVWLSSSGLGKEIAKFVPLGVGARDVANWHTETRLEVQMCPEGCWSSEGR